MSNDLPEHPLPQAAVDALRRGNKIEAIKIVRAELRIGLKEAKDLVEASDIGPASSTGIRATQPPLMTGEASRPGIWLWLAVIALAVAAWFGWK